MGDDYSNIQVYVGEPYAQAQRQLIIASLAGIVGHADYETVGSFDECNRVIAVGPAEKQPWICVYDSASYWTDSNLIESDEDTEALASGLSKHYPVITVFVSDSALLELKLWHASEMLDHYADRQSLFKPWDSLELKTQRRGNEQLWSKHLNLSTEQIQELRGVWDELQNERHIWSSAVHTMVKLLDWDEDYARQGYTIGYDGIPVKYSDRYPIFNGPVDATAFTELYFRKSNS